jgi:hypothetical protein
MTNNNSDDNKVFSLQVNKFGNDAFTYDGSVELSRILKKLCTRLLIGNPDSLEVGSSGLLRDLNGKTVGRWEVTSE